MNEQPTPETDAVWDDKSQNILEHARRLERERDEAREDLKVTQEAWVHVKTKRIEALRERDEALDTIADVLSALNPMHNEGPRLAALRVKEERDEARDAAEKAKAYKRVMKEDNAKLRRELDELNKRLIEVCQYGVVCTVEREDLRKELAELKEARK